MDPKGPPPNQPTPTANAPVPVATNPLNNRPIFLNTLAPIGDPRTQAASTSSSTAVLPTVGPAAATSNAKPGAPTGKLQSYSLHFAMCTDNCSSAIALTLVVVILFFGSIIFMFWHRKRRNREYEEETVVSVDTKFTGAGGRDLKSPFDTKGFNSFDEYNQQRNNTDSYYEDDYVEGYAGVAGFGPVKDNRQSSHAGIGGFGAPKTHEPMPALPMLNAPPPPHMPAPGEYDPDFADYQDEWERYQQEEAAAAAAASGQLQQQPMYRGGHDSTVEGMYFSPQAYEQNDYHANDHDADEDHAFEPSPYFQAKPISQGGDEEEQETYAIPMPQFEVEDYYMRDHLATDPVAPTATAPGAPVNWINAEEKNYWDQYKQ